MEGSRAGRREAQGSPELLAAITCCSVDVDPRDPLADLGVTCGSSSYSFYCPTVSLTVASPFSFCLHRLSGFSNRSSVAHRVCNMCK